MNKPDKLLSVRNIYVDYTQGKNLIHAVNGVSFDLEKGKILGLVGETGAGKTTIAKSILRLLPDPPAIFRSGEIILDGEDLVHLPEEQMRNIRGNRISMIFQDPMTALNPLMTIGEQIMEALELHNKGIAAREAAAKACEMLELVGIPRERFMEYPHQFSGGMKQRVVIAMALSCDPELLLADEPTTALDVTIQAQVLNLMRDLQRKYGTSMILITHDLGVVAEICDEVAVIYAGEIVEKADKYELFKNPKHPYTNGLFGSLPSMALGRARLNPIDGLPPDPTDLPRGCKFHPRCKYASEDCMKDEIPMMEVRPGHFCRCCHTEEA